MTLSAALIYQKTKQAELSQVKNLNIWGASLENISILRQCSNVETLSLSVNNISQLADLQGLYQLKELYLRKNQVSDLRQVMYLSRLPNLQVLWLSDNPIEQDPNYRLYVIRACPHLTRLDEKDVSDDEKALASRSRFSVPFELPDDAQAPAAPAEPRVEQVVSNYARAANPYPSNVNRPASGASHHDVPAQPVQPVQAVQAAQVLQAVPVAPAQPVAADVNQSVTLAVLNLLGFLDARSLETIRQQVDALLKVRK